MGDGGSSADAKAENYRVRRIKGVSNSLDHRFQMGRDRRIPEIKTPIPRSLCEPTVQGRGGAKVIQLYMFLRCKNL